MAAAARGHARRTGELCPLYAQHGYAEAALRYAAALADVSDTPVTIPLLRTYAALA